MVGAQGAFLDDGARLHLHHGPIDLILNGVGPARDRAYRRAAARFETVLEELVSELPDLRRRACAHVRFKGEIAARMQAAAAPFTPGFVTPMAAVAGAVADTICAAASCPGLTRLSVNNGGDVAFCLAEGQSLTAALVGIPGGRARLSHAEPVRGVATSGWRGRSHSLGIADSVTVLAATAAEADVAATMIANRVDLLGHPAIRRQPACALAPDSDLGTRPVTVAVGPLLENEAAEALERGADYAQDCRAGGLIHAAILSLAGQTRSVGPLPLLTEQERGRTPCLISH